MVISRRCIEKKIQSKLQKWIATSKFCCHDKMLIIYKLRRKRFRFYLIFFGVAKFEIQLFYYSKLFEMLNQCFSKSHFAYLYFLKKLNWIVINAEGCTVLFWKCNNYEWINLLYWRVEAINNYPKNFPYLAQLLIIDSWIKSIFFFLKWIAE